MAPIEFSREERAQIVARLQRYFRDELDQDIGPLPAQMLLDFLGTEIGPFFYNRALYDAQALLVAKAEEMADAVLGLEKKT